MARSRGVRYSYGDHRGKLRAAIPLEQIDPELLTEGLHELGFHLFRTDDRQAHRPKIFRGTSPDVFPGERRRADQDGDLVGSAELADFAGVERVRVIDHAESRDRRQP